MIDRPAFKDNAARLENREELNQELEAWLGRRTLQQVMEQLVPSGGVVGPVYDAAQIVDDPHYLAREDILDIEDPELGPTKMLGIVPKFSESPGAVQHAGPTVGEHNREVYGDWLGMDGPDLDALSGRGVI